MLPMARMSESRPASRGLPLPVPDLQLAVGELPAPPPESERWEATGALHVYGWERAGITYVLFPGFASYAFCSHDRSVHATKCHSAQDRAVVDTYYRSVVPLLLQSRGVEALHASGIVGPRGVYAFCGPSGRGKSTLACLLAERGYGLWADDAVVWWRTSGEIQTGTIPFAPKVAPQIPVKNVMAGGTRTVLRGVAVLERAVEPVAPSVTPVSGTAALRALLPNAYSFTLNRADNHRRMIEQYLDLVRQVRVWRVTFFPSMQEAPALLDVVEDELELHRC